MPLEYRAPAVDAAPASLSHISTFQRPYGPRILMDEAAVSAPAAPVAPAAPAAPVELPADAPADFSDASKAASYLAGLRHKKKSTTPAESAEPVEAAPAEEPEIPPADTDGDAAPVEEPVPSEEPEAPEPVSKEPPIDRPRSWTKEEDAEWQSLPRATQQKIVAREQERDAGLRRSQNEAAEQRKANDAAREAAEQSRLQYEDKAKSALKVLEREQLRDFPDIKSMDDVKALLTTDPLRYLQWDAHQKELVAASMAAKDAEARSTTEQATKWTSHVQKENELAAKIIPELADKEKGPALQRRAAERLVELGFSPAELNDFASGKERISIYDHRLQQLVKADLDLTDLKAKVAKSEAAKKIPPKPAAKVVPPVVRPGTTQPRASVDTAHIKALETKFNNSGSLEDGVAWRQARARAQQRRPAT